MAKEKLVTDEDRVEKLEATAKNKPAWKPTEEEDEARQLVYDRYKFMKDGEDRIEAEADWDSGDQEYRAYVAPVDEDDPRSNVNKPIAFAVIETELQETIQRNSRPKVKPREYSDEITVDLVNEILDYSFDVGNFDLQFYLAKKESLIRGTGFLMEYYREDKRVVKDPVLKKDKDGNITEEYVDREVVDFDDVYAEYVPCEMIYVDPAAPHIEKARDAIYREILHVNEFRRKYDGKRNFTNTEYVWAGGDTNRYTYYVPARDVSEAEEVEVLHYYNRAMDKYIVVANDIVIRNTPNPYPHKELPFTVFYCYKLPNKFYGFGIPKIIKALTEERNTLANLRMDAQKMQINKMFFFDDIVDLDELDLVARPHGGIPINTNGRPIRDVIQWIEYSDVKPSTYKEEEVLVEDIRRTVGVDDRVQGLNVGGTATEAAILKESSMKRINAKAILWEIDGMRRLGRLRLENIRFFYPIPKVERITEENGELTEKENYRTIVLKGKEYTMDEEGNLVTEDKDGYTFFKINPSTQKILSGDFDVLVDAEAQTPLSQPLQQAKITEMFNLLTTHPALIGMVDPKKAVRRYLRIFGEEPEQWLREDAASDVDMELQAQQENEIMIAGYPLPPTPGADQAHNQVHLMLAQSADMQQAPPEIQQLFFNHISGEAAQMGLQMPGGAPGGAPQPGVPGGNSPAQVEKPGVNPVDMNPNFQGGEERESAPAPAGPNG